MTPDFFNPQDLSFEQVKALTHGMLSVARVDGVHDSEMRMIREFYESCARKGDPRLEDVAQGPFDAAVASRLFESPELKKLFVKSLILLAFADGSYARAEDEVIRRYAETFGLNSTEVDQLHEATKEYLLAGLAHVKNLDALKEVRRRLDPH